MSTGLVGKTIGKYRVVEQIGRGGMAEVFKAYQPGLDRYVAIKVMHTFLVDDKEFLARFQREARVVASMRHPNVVQVHDFDVESDVSYMVMEYIDGETLKERMVHLQERGEWFSLEEVVRIVLAVGSALKYAHRLGMVHRDVKPANVMIDHDGQVILTDFGIAKILHGVGGSQLTASGAMVGTPSYISPEQGMGQPGDERSDIYSLGVMLYQMATGRLPYEADTPMAVVIKHIQGSLPMPRSVNPAVPESVERVILRALAKNPDDRYQHVGELMTDLKNAIGIAWDDTATKPFQMRVTPTVHHVPPTSQVTPATAAAGATRTPAVPGGRKTGLMVGGGIVVAIAIIAGLYFGVLSPRTTQPVAQATATFVRATSTLAPTPSRVGTPTNTPKPSVVRVNVVKDGAELWSEPDGDLVGLLGKDVLLIARARTSDDKWIRVEAEDGTTGWIKIEDLDMGVFLLQDIPQAVVLIKPSATPNLTATWAACKPVAKLAQDVTVPDGTQIRAGEKFTKTWRIENTGNCAFDAGSQLVFKSGERLGGPEAGVELPQANPSETADVSISLVAPALGGTYSGEWELKRASGEAMGEVAVSIVVVGPTATRPPTRTPLPSATPQASDTPTGPGPIGPVSSGPLQVLWAGNFYNCVATLETSSDGIPYWAWQADFFIEVYGGNAGYTISATECRWNYAEKRYVCRWGAREDGILTQSVTVSCPGCPQVSVSISAAAKRDGTSCSIK